MDTTELQAQARKFLKVRPVAETLPENGTLEVTVRLTGADGRELLPAVRTQASIQQPLDPALRELHLNQVQKTLRTTSDLFARSYAGRFAPEEKPSPAETPPRSVVVPMFPEAPAPELTEMMGLSKAKAAPDTDLRQPEPA